MTKKKQVKRTLKEELSPNAVQAKGQQQFKRFRVQFDFDYKGDPGKIIEGESATVPDMNLTIRQLLQNHSRGINSEVKVHEPLYFDTELPVITDITDVDSYREALQHRLDAVKKFQKEHEKEIQAHQQTEGKSIAESEKANEDPATGQTSIPVEEVTPDKPTFSNH